MLPCLLRLFSVLASCLVSSSSLGSWLPALCRHLESGPSPLIAAHRLRLLPPLLLCRLRRGSCLCCCLAYASAPAPLFSATSAPGSQLYAVASSPALFISPPASHLASAPPSAAASALTQLRLCCAASPLPRLSTRAPLFSAASGLGSWLQALCRHLESFLSSMQHQLQLLPALLLLLLHPCLCCCLAYALTPAPLCSAASAPGSQLLSMPPPRVQLIMECGGVI